MTSRRIDQVLILIGALLIAVSSYQLFWSHTFHSADSDILGKLSLVNRAVKTKSAFSIDWRDAGVGNSLTNDQLLYTDDESKAEVTFLSGDNLVIHANSLVRLQSFENWNKMHVQKGDFVASLKSGHPLNIGFNGKDFQLSGDAEVQISLSKSEGIIGIISGEISFQDGDQIVELDSSTALSIKGHKITTHKIAYQLSSPGPGEVIFVPSAGDKINFVWEPDSEGAVELSHHKDFKELIDPLSVLTSGSYFWRVRSDSGASLTRSFNIVQEAPLKILGPVSNQNLAIMSSPGAPATLYLQWLGVRDQTYEVEWSQNNELFKTVTENSQLMISPKESAPLKWRVRISDKTRPNAIWSDWQEVNIKLHSPPKIPSGLFPHEVEYQSYNTEPQTIEMSWISDSSVEWEMTYPDGRVETKIISENSYQITSTSFGTYQWRVRGWIESMAGPYTSEWSPKKSFTVTDMTSESELGIQRIQIKRPDQEVTFSWETADGSTNVFELSQEKDFRHVIIKRNVIASSTKVVIPKLGSYYWRSRQYLPDGSYQVSEPVRVIIEPAPAPEKPDKLPDLEFSGKRKNPPKTTWLNLLYDFLLSSAYADDVAHSVTLTLPPNNDASGFSIRIYKDLGLKNLVLEKRIYTTNFEWEDTLPGTYYWQYAVIDHFDRMSPYSDPSKLMVKPDMSPANPLQPKLAYPIKSAEIEVKDLNLKWSSSGKKAKYEVEVALDENFINVVDSQSTSKLKLVPKIEPSSQLYYWRVKAQVKGTIIVSNTGKFYLKQPLEKIIIADQLASSEKLIKMNNRLLLLWSPSKDSYNFKKDSEEGKIDGQVINGLELKGTTLKYGWNFNGEILRQSGEVFKGQDYLFQRILIDGTKTFYQAGNHDLSAGVAVGFASGQSYDIINSEVQSASVSSLSYGLMIRNRIYFNESLQLQGRVNYLLGEIKQIDLNADLVKISKNLLYVFGTGFSKRNYESNSGEQNSLKISLGIGKDF